MNDDQDQDAVIAFLSRPESLGVTGPIERIDTHGAIVFLADDLVFKLKRAVRYPYLDFSTVEKRRAVCEAELRLNRRTAPDLYLDVRSINAGPDGSLGFGPGVPVDWVIVMRRFDGDNLLEVVAERGDLDAPLVRALADRIAAFHAESEIAPVDDGAGRIRAVIAGNRTSLDLHAGHMLPSDDCARLHERSLAALDALASLLDRRGATGHVRHCHGDLHLANICLWQNVPTLFDCLEFDTDLATTDVLYDLAFLVMDLWERDLRPQASLLFNRYLDMTSESDGMAAIPLFLSMRAAIRAHVGATAAGQQRDAARAEAKRSQACAYLAAALSFLDQPGPRLIAVGGLSGTGKSTLAGTLAPFVGGAPGARWLRTDVIRKRFAGVTPEIHLPPEAYRSEQSGRVYDQLLSDTRSTLAAGRSVIVDGVFAKAEERAHVAQVAEDLGLPFTGLWLEAPKTVLLARVAARQGDASDADAQVVARQLDYDLGDLTGWHRLDASGTIEQLAARARGTIEREAGR